MSGMRIKARRRLAIILECEEAIISFKLFPLLIAIRAVGSDGFSWVNEYIYGYVYEYIIYMVGYMNIYMNIYGWVNMTIGSTRMNPGNPSTISFFLFAYVFSDIFLFNSI